VSSVSFDVAVVGAGIVGSAIAYECARRGARVVLLDRDAPGAHASGAAAGMLAPCSEAHQRGPFLDLARDSLQLWPDFARAVHEDGGVDPELHLDGLLRVALTEADAEHVQGRLRWQYESGITAGTWVDPQQARDLEPALNPNIEGAAWYDTEGHVHSRHAVRALVAAAQAHGAHIRTAAPEVTGPAANGGGVALADGTTIPAHRVILAAGAWLGELSARFGARLPVTPVHGQLLVLDGLPRTPRRVLYAGHHGYVVAKRDGSVLAGATEEDRGFDTTPDPAATRRLHAQAQRILDGVTDATAHRVWTGLRPATPDRLPLLGPLPTSDGNTTVVAGAHHRNGVLLAPITARGIADIALDGRTPEGWDAFDPRRVCA
jgi:glycine oxidase